MRSPTYELRLDQRMWRAAVELHKHDVTIFPSKPPDVFTGDAGSGLCVSIAGRYFIATAAHVIELRAGERIGLVAAAWLGRALVLIGQGMRRGEGIDVGWIEIHSREAKQLGAEWLPLARLAPYRDGREGMIAICGGPVSESTRTDERFESTSHLFPVAALDETIRATLGGEDTRLYFRWRKPEFEASGGELSYPEPKGISGGPIWALNMRDGWVPHHAQVIGLEYATGTTAGERYVVGNQIQCWLEMVAEDVPTVAAAIRAHLSGCQLRLGG